MRAPSLGPFPSGSDPPRSRPRAGGGTKKRCRSRPRGGRAADPVRPLPPERDSPRTPAAGRRRPRDRGDAARRTASIGSETGRRQTPGGSRYYSAGGAARGPCPGEGPGRRRSQSRIGRARTPGACCVAPDRPVRQPRSPASSAVLRLPYSSPASLREPWEIRILTAISAF